MPADSPLLTSVLARDVYALTKLSSIQEAIAQLNTRHNGNFSFNNENLLTGKTGGPGILKSKTAFGFTVIGKGALKGNAYIIFRGTQYLADWLTNLNVSASRSALGQPVHDGFNKAFLSMKSDVQKFLESLGKEKIHSIHCIGHSLGGAIATLCAEWIRSTYGAKPYLYTFGSPRVGLVGFSNLFTRELSADRIFRVYHKTDVVPHIPTWPYIHVPHNGTAYYLPSPGVLPGAEYHDMRLYVESIGQKSWLKLEGLKPQTGSDSSVEHWLKHTNGPLSLTISNIEWLNRAILYVLRQCLKGVSWAISETFASTFTLMDQLAYILNKGVNLAENISSWVILLIRRIMAILGMNRVVQASDMTRDFIRDLLIRLKNRLNQVAQQALNRALVRGRGV